MAPIITAALLASNPKVAITPELANMKKNAKAGTDPFSTTLSTPSADTGFSTSWRQSPSQCEISTDM